MAVPARFHVKRRNTAANLFHVKHAFRPCGIFCAIGFHVKQRRTNGTIETHGTNETIGKTLFVTLVLYVPLVPWTTVRFVGWTSSSVPRSRRTRTSVVQTAAQAPLLQRIDHQTAEKLRVEVRAFGGHALPMLADGFHMAHRRGHHERR